MHAAEGKPITILMAEDDPDDRMLVQEAFEESRLMNDLRFVEDGEQIMAYLRHDGKYHEVNAPRPAVILLDLNMPKKSGREVLEELKEDPELRDIPVIVLTTSEAEEDIVRCYCSGASGFIVKPVTFQRLVDVLKTVGDYWLGIVQLPKKI
jgi:CheY-like chemotaxis protein